MYKAKYYPLRAEEDSVYEINHPQCDTEKELVDYMTKEEPGVMFLVQKYYRWEEENR